MTKASIRRLTGAAFVSLDGIMQGPGGPTEDPTGGFDQGGWVFGMFDDLVGATVGKLFDGPFDLLLGRKTYEIFAAYWPYITEGEDEGIAKAFNGTSKHVLTRGGTPMEWERSHALPDIEAVARLKQTDGPDLVIQGSSTIYPQLLTAGLIDELILMIFPITLGKGKRLFGDDTPASALKMTDHRVSPKGVVVAHFVPDGAVPTGSFAMPEPSAREVARQERMRREG
jgi:dihydrofolate reductase